MPMPQLTRAVAARMASEYPNVGAEVFWGRERFDRAPVRTSIQVTHDTESLDSWEDASITRENPSYRWEKFTGLKVTALGQSTQPGATQEHHEAIVDAAVDAFMVCLAQVASGRGYALRGVTGSFQAPPDDQPAEMGARYVIRMQVGRGVREPEQLTSTAVPALTGKANSGGVVQTATTTE